MYANTQETSIVGELLFLRVYPSGWGMGKIRTGQNSIGANGNALNGLKENTVYEFFGQSVVDPKYGAQLKVSRVSVHIPQNRLALAKYLAKNYQGVGEKTAQKFIDHHLASGKNLEDLRQIILHNPFAVDFSCVSKRKTKSKDNGGSRDAIYRQFASRLGGLDTSDAVFRTLAGHYATKFENNSDPVGCAWNEFSQNPYLPIREVAGYGFMRADVLGRRLGYPKEAKTRIAALATFAIDEGCSTNGHTYLTIDDFKEKVSKIDGTVIVEDAIQAAVELGEPLVLKDGRYYIKKYYLAETWLKTDFAKRLERSSEPLLKKSKDDLIHEVTRVAAKVGFTLDPSQMDAVVGLLTSKLSVHSITAGPGCGKTAIMEIVVSILIKQLNVGFCAPTGKAAKVLNTRVKKIGAEATTIHSMLGVSDTGGFLHNSDNKLPFDLLVVDETSMVDVCLMKSLISAVNKSCHVVFLGDDKQLPSVGPGNCLADILRMPFDHHRLTTTHRNQGGILEVVNLAGSGFADFRQREDVRFIERLPEATEETIQNVLDIYERELEQVGGDFAQVGLLIARRKGDINNPGWNTTYLNHTIRNRYNPNGAKVPGSIFRIDDRIIIRKNIVISYPDPQTGKDIIHSVVNGDTGYIRGYSLKNSESENEDISDGMVEWLELELDDGRHLKYASMDMGALDLSYAMTVHSSQGSEYQRLISICVNGAANFIHRGILFTAWSRAQKQLTIIGEMDVIASTLRRSTPKRNSNLNIENQ